MNNILFSYVQSIWETLAPTRVGSIRALTYRQIVKFDSSVEDAAGRTDFPPLVETMLVGTTEVLRRDVGDCMVAMTGYLVDLQGS